MLTRRNLWIIISGSIIMTMLLWFGSYKRNYEPDLPKQFGNVSALNAVSIQGEAIDLSFLTNSVTAINFFSRSCPESCQEAMLQMNKLQKLMRGREGFKLLTLGIGFRGPSNHLVGPVERLAMDRSNWTFAVESDSTELNLLQLIRLQFPESVHILDSGSAVVLVGRAGEFRGVYNVQDKFESVRLQNHVYNLVSQFKQVADVSQRIN
jgi:hypothetical protein